MTRINSTVNLSWVSLFAYTLNVGVTTSDQTFIPQCKKWGKAKRAACCRFCVLCSSQFFSHIYIYITQVYIYRLLHDNSIIVVVGATLELPTIVGICAYYDDTNMRITCQNVL